MKPPSVNNKCLILSAAIALIMVCAGTSHAAIYTVDSCQHPDGSVAGTSGWTSFVAGPYMYTGDMCGNQGGLDASFDPNVEHDYGVTAGWRFTAPAGTTLSALTAQHSGGAARDRVNGSPVTFIRTETRTLESCGTPYGCQVFSGPLAYDLQAAREISFGVECGGAPGGACPAGFTSIALKQIHISLNDVTAPTLTRTPSGTLTTANGNGQSVRTVAYTASDSGSGVYRHRLIIDNREAATGSPDAASGTCMKDASASYVTPTPCPLTTSGSIGYDTKALSDGAHQVKLEVLDATDVNRVNGGPWDITVDNLPPAIAAPRLTGEALEGESLACAATVNGQNPTISYRWLRTAPDGSDEKVIVGAVNAAYRLTASDVGKKVLCEVSATDGGGTAARKSTITDGPFAGGAVVTARPASAGAAGVAGADGSNGSNGTNGSNGSNGAAATAASVATAAAAAAAAVPPCTSGTVQSLGTATTKLVRSYNRSSVPLSGRLLSANGAPLGGRALELVQTVVRSGTATRTKVAATQTAGDGSFRIAAPAGPSRALQLVDPGCGSVGPIVTERVRGLLRAVTTTRRVRNKQTARIKGRVLGGYLGRGIPLELQVKVGKQWRDVKHATTNSRGDFKVGYRFLRTFVRYTYSFRIVTRAGGGWPYMPATSRVVKVRVN